MIQVQNLSKRYRDLVAVDDLSFEVERGQILGFLGPNGAGKSTTMKILTGFMPASSGSARIGGFDVFEDPVEVKRRVGYLPENPPVYTEMSVAGYLAFVARLKGIPGRHIKDEVQRVSELASVAHVLKRVIGNMSKGYRQRVGLAQALIGEPEVLILDEPTVGLDPHQIREVRDLIRSLAGKHTIILSTHILPEVTAVCEKVLIINGGKMVVHEDLATLQSAAGGEGQEHPSLEEIFLRLTG